MNLFRISILITLVITNSLLASYREPGSYRNGRSFEFGPGKTYDPKSASNVNWMMERALRQLNSAGGGRLIVYARRNRPYQMEGISVPSNCHIIVRSNVVIEMLRPGVLFGFHGGVRNSSIRGNGGRFTIRIPRFGNPVLGRSVDSGRAFALTHCDNILIGGITIEDPYESVHSSIEMAWATSDDSDEIPNNVRISNIDHPYESHYGFGIIQVQAAENSDFENFLDRRGITLRLETGSTPMNLANAGGMFNITGTNMMSIEGHCSVKMEPHGIRNGAVKLRRINAVSSQFAIYSVAGSLHKFSAQEIRRNHMTPGSFSELDLFDVRGTYTSNKAPSSYSKIRYYEPGLFARLRQDPDNPNAGLTGPSAAVYGNYGGIRNLVGGGARMRQTVRGSHFPSRIPAYTTAVFPQNRSGNIPD